MPVPLRIARPRIRIAGRWTPPAASGARTTAKISSAFAYPLARLRRRRRAREREEEEGGPPSLELAPRAAAGNSTWLEQTLLYDDHITRQDGDVARPSLRY